ncbi:MAG: glycosyl hydrolase family 28-related protein [Candidatus Sumerlaeota bacterium]|nr:glycosyl hydrolase family 28-related protein [Candidatus Sumerlaeota bacterium]
MTHDSMRMVEAIGLLLWTTAWTAAQGAGPDSAVETRGAVIGLGGLQCAVTDYGAAGDGTTDDSAAFQRALDAINAAGKGALHIPPGSYRIGARVSEELTSAGLSIIGEGQGVSCLLGDNSAGVLWLHDEWCKSQITIRDLSIYAARQGAGTAIEVSSPARGVRNYRTFLMENVDIRGAGLPTRNYFDCGIKAIAQWRPLFRNVIFSGVLDPSLKQDGEEAKADDSPFYKPACGIQADWCYAPSFQHCYVWSAHTGYRIVSEGERPQGPEDCAFYRSNAVGCRIGIDVATPAIEPQLVLESCHINCRDIGVRLTNRKFFQLTGNLFYSHGNPKYPYTDVMLINCYAGIISGNIFHSVARDNLRPAPPSGRVNLHADGKSRDILIAGNMFNAKGQALAVENSGANVSFKGNQCANPNVTIPSESD